MKKFLNFLNNFEENILSVLLPFMCVVIFVATFCRYTKIIGLPWAEELARYCMIWLIFLGIGTGAKKGEHFAVTVVTMMLPKMLRKAAAVLRTLILVAFNGFVAFYCMKIIENQMMMEQVTPSLKWPMWIIYLAIPIGSVLMALRYVWHTYLEMSGRLADEGGAQA